jgi:hypothetical protein
LIAGNKATLKHRSRSAFGRPKGTNVEPSFRYLKFQLFADGVYKTTLMAVANLVDGIRVRGLADNCENAFANLITFIPTGMHVNLDLFTFFEGLRIDLECKRVCQNLPRREGSGVHLDISRFVP